MQTRSRLESFAHLAAVIAIVVSLWSVRGQRDLEHESYTQTLIHDQYELCRVLDALRVEHPEISHMLALPAQSGDKVWETYELFEREVRALFDPKEDLARSRAALYLQEHAVALHVADIYEQTLYQHELAKDSGDDARAEVLEMLCKYYEGRMLRNPRLRYHWDHGVSDMMETSTRIRYDHNVREAYPDDPVDATSPLE
ncbi:MAG: hypothetical protein HZA52_10060 [Planctomycetes bacterium]|nr:hypothetical protein [Planctomycetota bacterium]